MTLRPSGLACTAVALLLSLNSGCKRDDVQTYQAPKESAPPAEGINPAAGAATAGAEPRIEHAAGTPWKVPAGWETKPPGDVRIASYGVTTPDGRAVDISVVALNGTAGTELDNVNRWRKEIELEAIAESEIASARTTTAIGTRTGTLYEFKSEKPTLEGKFKPASIVGVLPAGELTVFFKMRGESALLTVEKAHFLEWLKSVQTEASPGGAPAAAEPTAGALAATPPPADMRGQVAPPPQVDLPTWEPPAHWKSAGPKPMRVASFEVPNPAGTTPGDLSISTFSGAAGGFAANVNRWRGQVGLPPADEATLAKESEKLTLAGGSEGTLVDLRGATKRIVGVIAPQGDKTWFYKLTGDDALLTKERDGFIKFVKSVKY